MSRLYRWREQTRRLKASENYFAVMRKLVGTFLFIAILVGLVVAVQLIPEWQVKRASVRSAVPNPEGKTTPAEVAALQNEMRKTFIQIVGGAFALIALYFTYRRVKVAEQGHITDRFTKAIEQLGAMTAENKPNIEVRLGAIYALERIAFDSPRDHWTIMEVLTAYVRQNTPAPATPLPHNGNSLATAGWEEENKMAIARGPSTEIQAILTVLGRRRHGKKREPPGQVLDLRATDLRGASLRTMHLEGADFRGAFLVGCQFRNAYLNRALFHEAVIDGAGFREAHLERAVFRGARVQRASFVGAHLEGATFITSTLDGTSFNRAHLSRTAFTLAHLEGCSFFEADLKEADFQSSSGLRADQIKEASNWDRAQFDGAFHEQLGSNEHNIAVRK
jgi:uncharacterized protein YjbI with pentapeptide repeats